MKNARLLQGWMASAAMLGLAAAWLTGCASPNSTPIAPESARAGFLYRTNYHGWENSIWVSNGQVEAIIVPEVGRIMQFRFAGETDSPFWENQETAGLSSGQPGSSEAVVWREYGGDRVWPSPQIEWGNVMSTNWPPPAAFDGSRVQAQVNGWVVTLSYPADPNFGIRVKRRIELPAGQTKMEVFTEFEKLDNKTIDAGVWVLTQLKDPVGLYARLPMLSKFPQGFQPMSGRLPPSLAIRDRLLSLGRDSENDYRLGLEVGSVLWMNDDIVLKIDSPRLPDRKYPENGISAIVSTHQNPQDFVQVDMLAPVAQIRQGHVLKQRSTYTLLRRQELDPRLEAARLLRP
jgi:hypothetical protein